MLQLSVVGYPFVNPGPVGGVGTFKNEQAGKVEKILTEAGAYPQVPTQPIFFDHFQTYLLSLCTRFSNFVFRTLFQTRKKIEFKTSWIFCQFQN